MTTTAVSETTVSFRVEGEFLTDIARTRVIEGRHDHGFRILHEGLCGISSDQVLSVLRGDCRLVGTNDVELVEDGDGEWKKELLYHFAGTWVTSGGRYMRPYAAVTSWGVDDMGCRDRITKDSDSVRDRRGEEHAGSSLFYADDPLGDALKLCRTDVTKITEDYDLVPDRQGRYHFLFREVRNYPFQIVPAHSSAQEALDHYVASGGRIRRVGYAETFCRQDFKVRYETDDPTEPRPEIESHARIDGPDSHEASRIIGRHRAKMVDVEKSGRTVEDYDAIQEVIRDAGRPMKDRIQSFYDAMALQKTFPDRVPTWARQVVEQAGDEWITVLFRGKELRIPRAPFEQWCLRQTDGVHLAMPWQPVCPQGVKMMGDDPYHTDFLVGAGLQPDAMIADSELSDLVYELRFKVQQEKLGFSCSVLSGSGQRRGTVVHPEVGDSIPDDAIIVLRDASPKYLDLALRARAVIVERGGTMAHLVTVARGQDGVIVRVDRARELYPAGSSVTVDASAGRVELHQGNMREIWEVTRGTSDEDE